MNNSPVSLRRWYSITYPWLATGELITGVTATVETEDPNAEDAADPLWPIVLTQIDNANKRVLFLAGGDGIEGNIYHAKIAITTSNQQAKTDCIPFVITGDC